MKIAPFVPNHLHLIVRGFMVNPPTSEDVLNSFLIELVDRVRMEILTGPHSVYCHDLGNEGVTGTVTLSTSHASMHVWDQKDPALFQFDIYSCSEFTSEEVLSLLDEKFSIFDVTYLFIDRNEKEFFEKERGFFNNL
jgi:S-adenosylmethionine/arginine decarboxylase-like enzyme